MIDKARQYVFCLVPLFAIPQELILAQEIIPMRFGLLATEGPVNAVHCLPGGQEVVIGSMTQGSSDVLEVWDIDQRQAAHGTTVGYPGIESLSVDSEGTTLAATGWRPGIFLWNLTNWNRLKGPIIDKKDSVCCVCLQASGAHLAIVTKEQGLRIWDISEGKWTAPLVAPPLKISTLCYGEKLWVGTEIGEIWQYDKDRWQRLFAVSAPPVKIICLQMVECQRLFVLTDDGVVRWISEGQVAGRIFPEARLKEPVSMAVHRSGDRLATVTYRGQLRFWSIFSDSAELAGQVECFDTTPLFPGDTIADLSIDDASGIIAVARSSGGVRLFRSDWWTGGGR